MKVPRPRTLVQCESGSRIFHSGRGPHGHRSYYRSNIPTKYWKTSERNLFRCFLCSREKSGSSAKHRFAKSVISRALLKRSIKCSILYFMFRSVFENFDNKKNLTEKRTFIWEKIDSIVSEIKVFYLVSSRFLYFFHLSKMRTISQFEISCAADRQSKSWCFITFTHSLIFNTRIGNSLLFYLLRKNRLFKLRKQVVARFIFYQCKSQKYRR